ncbi:MAG: CYCXC family (seleno)protein [Terriglobales bacterium]
MIHLRTILPPIAVVTGLAGMLALGAAAQQPAKTPVSRSQSAEPPVVHEPGVPAFHASAPRSALPPTLPPSDFTDPRVQNAYAMAAHVKDVLYQEPCYCRCDKSLGHTSLYSCFAGTHASVCETCLMEGIFTYLQTQKGKTPGQIRAEIIRGDWKAINLNQFLAPGRY